MRHSPGNEPSDVRFWQARALAPHLPIDHVAGKCPHPKGNGQSLRFRFLAEHISHRFVHDFEVTRIAKHGRVLSIAGGMGAMHSSKIYRRTYDPVNHPVGFLAATIHDRSPRDWFPIWKLEEEPVPSSCGSKLKTC